MKRPPRHFVIFGLLCLLAANSTGRAETDGAVESRGLNLPRVTVPAPPPPPATQQLAVRTVGEGRGTVTLPPANACPPACSAKYIQGAPVMLAAIPAPGSTFAGWSGDCRGTAPCKLSMDRPRTVEAKFNKLQAPPATAPAFPETTKTPSPTGPIPIPYPNLSTNALAPELAAISTMLANGKPANDILNAWKGYVTRRAQAKQELDVPGTIQQIQRQAEAQVRARTEVQKARLSGKLQSAGDDAQLANVELQNLLQKQQQTLQMMSNISKMMHDTATAVIRKIGG